MCAHLCSNFFDYHSNCFDATKYCGGRVAPAGGSDDSIKLIDHFKTTEKKRQHGGARTRTPSHVAGARTFFGDVTARN